jgi:dipeptidyl aminopeptidase/acylaminoacyl peptidase
MRGVVFRICLLGTLLLVRSRAHGADDLTKGKATPVPVEAVLNMKYFSQYAPVSFSADGEWLAYAVRENTRIADISPEDYERTGIPHYASGADIYILNLKTRQLQNITNKDDNWLPTWSPDGRLLAFLSDRDGSGQARLWIWDVRQNRMWMASTRNIRGAEIEWLPDSSGMVVAVAAVNAVNQARELTRAEQTLPHSEQKTSIASVRIYQADSASEKSSREESAAPWNLDRYRADLALIHLRGDESTIVAAGERIGTFFLSPNATELAYSIPKRFELPGSQQTLFDLHLIDLRNGKSRILASDIRLNPSGGNFRWSPDGQWISYITAGMEEKRSDCYAIEIRSGSLSKLTDLSVSSFSRWDTLPLWGSSRDIYFLRDGELWRTQIGGHAVRLSGGSPLLIRQVLADKSNQLWISKGSNTTIVLVHDQGTEHDGFYRVDLKTGSISMLPENGGCYTCVVKQSSVWVTPDGQALAFIKESTQAPADLWISSSSMTDPQRITSLNPQLDHQVMGKARLVEWIGDDGQRLRGTLLLPVGFREEIRYPLVVWVYGGDSGVAHLDTFGVDGLGPLNMQLLATRGYAVLVPGAPQTLGTPMLDLAKTILPGVNKLIEMGIVNPDQIGVMGHSYGGYSALSLIVQTRRFAAAVDIDGMGDLVASYGEMDVAGSAYGTATAEHGQELMGGSPWEFRDRYIENSPFFFLDRVSTPLLIVHGDADTFVQPFLADQVFVALRRLGCEVEYARYHGEGHDPGLWNYGDQIDLSYRIIEWLDRHLKDKSGAHSSAGKPASLSPS